MPSKEWRRLVLYLFIGNTVPKTIRGCTCISADSHRDFRFAFRHTFLRSYSSYSFGTGGACCHRPVDVELVQSPADVVSDDSVWPYLHTHYALEILSVGMMTPMRAAMEARRSGAMFARQHKLLWLASVVGLVYLVFVFSRPTYRVTTADLTFVNNASTGKMP